MRMLAISCYLTTLLVAVSGGAAVTLTGVVMFSIVSTFAAMAIDSHMEKMESKP